MRITIENTTKIVMVNGVQSRVWEGRTDAGIEVHCFITRLAVKEGQDPGVYLAFERELKECRQPSEDMRAIPGRVIL